MPTLLLYLLKANVALVLFYLAYHLVLRKLTFYHLNRLFLVFGIMFSAVYPLVDLTELFSRHAELAVVQSYAVVIPVWTSTAIPEQAAAFDYWLIPVGLFWLGCGMMLLRLIVQFVSLYKIHRASVPASYQGVEFRKVNGISEAFSFWKTIYLNPAQHQSPELESILRHEQIHVNGWHTLDVLLAELSTVFYWFNPGVWLMKKAMKENLEFIADQHVVNAGVDRVAYQYLLLKVVGATQPQLANQFNFPSLKRRIAMMNKMPTNKANRLRLLVVLPLVTVLLVAFRSASQEDIATLTEAVLSEDEAHATTLFEEDYEAFLKRNPDVKRVYWVPDEESGKGSQDDRMVIELKSGGLESYRIAYNGEIAAAEKKYGKLPIKPTRPPMIDSSELPAPPAPYNPEQDDRAKKVAEEHKAFYARNPQVRKIEWVSRNEIRVRLETTEEIYDMADKKSRARAEKKYGQFPSSPGPAQVVTRAEFESQRNDAVQQQNGERIFSPTDIGYYQDRNNLPVDYTNFLKRNPTIDKVGWKIHPEKGPQAVVLFLRSGTTEIYNLNDKESMAKARSKYGEFPNLLPPPPPVMIKDELPPPPPPAPAAPDAPPAPPAPDKPGLVWGVPETVLYYIDGVEATKEAVEKLDPKQIYNMNVVKGETAKKVLGDKAANGVISLTTEANKNSAKVMEFNKKLLGRIDARSPGNSKNKVLISESTDNPVTDATEIAFVLYPDKLNQAQIDQANNLFKQNGLNVEFKATKKGDEIVTVTITDKTQNQDSVFSVAGLKEQDKVILVRGHKPTGKVTMHVVGANK